MTPTMRPATGAARSARFPVRIGILIGALYGVAAYRSPGDRALALRALVLGAVAMAAADVPAAVLEATNPAEWGAAGWISDIVPHAAYGLVTAAAFASIASAPRVSATPLMTSGARNT